MPIVSGEQNSGSLTGMVNKESNRYFLAVIPPNPIYDQAQHWKEYFRDEFGSKASLNSPPHITLHMPFMWPDRKALMLKQKLAEFFHSQNGMTIQLSNFGKFGKRVIFLNVEQNLQLDDLHANLHRFCKRSLNLFNADYQDRPFYPHLTLAFRDLKTDQFDRAWKEFGRKQFEAGFQVMEVHLLRHNGKIWEAEKSFILAN